MNEGKLYELQPKNTYNLYLVKFDVENDLKRGVISDDQEPIEKKLLSSGHVIKN